MSGFFRWSMRNGAKILFALALVMFLVGLVAPLYDLFSMTSDMAGQHDYYPSATGLPLRLQLYAQVLSSALFSAVLPFVGALLIDRIDRRWPEKEEGE